jgi:hypothetical protein
LHFEMRACVMSGCQVVLATWLYGMETLASVSCPQ